MNNQLNGNLQLQNEKVLLLNEQVNAYKTQISALEKSSGLNWAMVITVILGLIVVYLLRNIKI